MSPSGRMLASSILKSVLAITIVCCGFQLQAAAQIENPVRDQTFVNRPLRSIECVSCGELADCWLQYRWPRTAHAADIAFESIDSFADVCQQVQRSQYLWFEQTLAAIVAQWSETSDQLLANWSNRISAGVTLDERFALSQQAAYWDYYHDCDRWGVELTRALDVPVPKQTLPVLEAQKPENPKVGVEESSVQLLVASEQIRTWLRSSWRYIEFITVETSVLADRVAHVETD